MVFTKVVIIDLTVGNLIDSYTLKARYTPALLTLFPSIIFLSLVIIKLNFDIRTILVSSVFESLVFPMFFSEICRNQGKKQEEKNYKKWKGKPTAILLRIQDNSYDDVTKDKLYENIKLHFNIDLKSDNSDKNISNAVDHIKSIFHKNNDKLLDEHLVEYGFVRNLAGCNFLLLIQSLILLITVSGYIYYNCSYENFPYESIIIVMIYLLLSILSIILGKFVYPKMVKDRAFRYAKTLIETYYRESNNVYSTFQICSL